MDQFKETLQKFQAKLRHISLSQTLVGCRRWLFKNKLILGAALLVGILLKFALERLTLVTLQGQAMGAHYSIQYLDRWGRNYKDEIDALLASLEQTFATHLPDSELSSFNKYNCSEFYFKSPFLYPVLAKSKEVHRSTQGAFDPTVLPLVEIWKTGLTHHTADPNNQALSKLRQYVSFDYVVANEQRAKKLKEGVRLDLDGIAKGYAADVVAKHLKTHGIQHMLVTLGKACVAHGKRKKHQPWEVKTHASLLPLEQADLHIAINLVDKALAIASKYHSAHNQSQGSYTCFIDPITGCPASHILLAVAVIAPDCMTADAYATAMMTRGLAFAQALVGEQQEIQAFLVYENEKGEVAFYTSAGLQMQQDKLGRQVVLQVLNK